MVGRSWMQIRDYPSGIWSVKAVDHTKHGCLSTSGTTDHRQKLPFRYFQIKIYKHLFRFQNFCYMFKSNHFYSYPLS